MRPTRRSVIHEPTHSDVMRSVWFVTGPSEYPGRKPRWVSSEQPETSRTTVAASAGALSRRRMPRC